MTKKKLTAWIPAEWELADASAIQALNRGDATPDMQKRALKWIIEKACRTYEISYDPESSRNSDYAEGKRGVGLQIVKLVNINLSKFPEKQTLTKE